MAEQGPMAIAMRLRNQLQNVYKLDPLRNEVSKESLSRPSVGARAGNLASARDTI